MKRTCDVTILGDGKCLSSKALHVFGMNAVFFRNSLGRSDTRISEHKARGFTLIELLVVISIISLLIAMLLPSIEKARASGEQIVCATNLRQMGVAMEAYINEWDDWMPYYEAWYEDHHRSHLHVTPDGSWWWGKKLRTLGAVMNSYLDAAGDANADILNTEQGLWCPSHPGEVRDDERFDKAPIPSRTSASTHGILAAYGYNHRFLGTQWTDSSNAKGWFYRKKSFVKFPSNIISHADNAFSLPGSHTGYHYWTKVNRTQPLINSTKPSEVVAGRMVDMIPDFRDELIYPIGERHLEGGNAVCLDGHSEWQTQRRWHMGDFDHRWTEPGSNFVKRIPD